MGVEKLRQVKKNLALPDSATLSQGWPGARPQWGPLKPCCPQSLPHPVGRTDDPTFQQRSPRLQAVLAVRTLLPLLGLRPEKVWPFLWCDPGPVLSAQGQRWPRVRWGPQGFSG